RSDDSFLSWLASVLMTVVVPASKSTRRMRLFAEFATYTTSEPLAPASVGKSAESAIEQREAILRLPLTVHLRASNAGVPLHLSIGRLSRGAGGAAPCARQNGDAGRGGEDPQRQKDRLTAASLGRVPRLSQGDAQPPSAVSTATSRSLRFSSNGRTCCH